VNSSADDAVEVATGVVTVTSTTPALCAGLTAVIEVDEFTVKLGAGVLPNSTEVAPVKLVPVIATLVPPAVLPAFGLIELTLGELSYVYSSAGEVAEVPRGVVTVTSTVPDAPAGLETRISVDEMRANVVAAVEPKLTELAPVRLVPVTVTAAPPAVEPDEGLTAVTVGAPS
jgi:hypothetical protein